MTKKVSGKGPTGMQQYLYLLTRSVMTTSHCYNQATKTRAAPLEIVTLTEIKHNNNVFPCEGATAEIRIKSSFCQYKNM